MIEYHTYTIADVRAWLYKGVQNGLSDRVISKVRANAIIHNPYVEEDMVIVTSATDGDKVVGYTAMFPDYLVRPKVQLTVPTTLYADPEYADEFIGYNVTKLLHDTANGRMVIGTDMAKEAAIIDKLLGLKIEYVNRRRYVMDRTIHVRTLRNVGSWILEPYRRTKQNRYIEKLHQSTPSNVRVEYTDFVDNEAYQFIEDHSEGDLFLRSQEMLNWILRYPFSVKAFSANPVVEKNYFIAQSNGFEQSLVKVYKEEQLIGIYMLGKHNRNVFVKMLYTTNEEQEIVYNALLRHVLQYRPEFIYSHYQSLNNYIDKSKISLVSYEQKFNYSHPKELPYQSDLQFQGTDGDMFV